MDENSENRDRKGISFPDLSPKGEPLGLFVGAKAVARRGHEVTIMRSFKFGEEEVFVDENNYQYRADGTESYDRNATSQWDLVRLSPKEVTWPLTVYTGSGEILTVNRIDDDKFTIDLSGQGFEKEYNAEGTIEWLMVNLPQYFYR